MYCTDTDPDLDLDTGGGGKMCLGGSVHWPSASSETNGLPYSQRKFQ